MYITYANRKIEKLCSDYKYSKTKLPIKIATKLMQAINFIENATSLKAIMEFEPYNFHDLKGKRDGEYSIDIGSRRDGYRLILIFKETKEKVFSNSIEITEVNIKEMGNHYD